MARFGCQPLEIPEQMPDSLPGQISTPKSPTRSTRQAAPSPARALLLAKFGGASPIRRFPPSPASGAPPKRQPGSPRRQPAMSPQARSPLLPPRMPPRPVLPPTPPTTTVLSPLVEQSRTTTTTTQRCGERVASPPRSFVWKPPPRTPPKKLGENLMASPQPQAAGTASYRAPPKKLGPNLMVSPQQQATGTASYRAPSTRCWQRSGTHSQQSDDIEAVRMKLRSIASQGDGTALLRAPQKASDEAKDAKLQQTDCAELDAQAAKPQDTKPQLNDRTAFKVQDTKPQLSDSTPLEPQAAEPQQNHRTALEAHDAKAQQIDCSTLEMQVVKPHQNEGTALEAQVAKPHQNEGTALEAQGAKPQQNEGTALEAQGAEPQQKHRALSHIRMKARHSCPALEAPGAKLQQNESADPKPLQKSFTARKSLEAKPPLMICTALRTQSPKPLDKDGTASERYNTPSKGSASRRSSYVSPAPTPTRRRQLSGAADPVCVIGVGAGGIVELVKHLSNDMVCWALLRFQVGGGNFERTKLVAIHCNGESTPVMLRGWLNERSTEVISLLGDVHANIDVMGPKELTVDHLCQRLLPVFAADHITFQGVTLSLESLKEEMNAQLQREAEQRAKAAATTREPTPAAPPIIVMTPTFAAPLTAADGLRAVGADKGSCNWVLLEPRSLELHSSGLGGLEDLKAHLAEDQVLFGALRLSFGSSSGSGGARTSGITKHIFVHWVGPRVSILQRGKLNARLASAATLVGQYCGLAFRRQAHSLADLGLDDVISELRRLTVVDTMTAADGIAASRISAAEYLAGLKEEASAREAIMQAKQEAETVAAPPISLVVEKPGPVDVKTAIKEVRATSGEWNWVLCGWERPTPNMPPPSPCRGGA